MTPSVVSIPFVEVTRIHAVVIGSPSGPSSPARVRFFVNRTDIVGCSSVTRLQPTQELNLGLADFPTEAAVYHLDPHKFSRTQNVALWIDANYGADVTQITRIWFFWGVDEATRCAAATHQRSVRGDGEPARSPRGRTGSPQPKTQPYPVRSFGGDGTRVSFPSFIH